MNVEYSLLETAVSQGIWCVVAIIMIVRQNAKYDKLEMWVREEVLNTLKENNQLMKELKDKLNGDQD